MARYRVASPTDRLLANVRRREREAQDENQPAFTTEEEMRSKVILTQAEMAAWNQIAAGRPMRNSTAVLAAIKMKMEFTMAKPAQKLDTNQQINVEIINLAPVSVPAKDLLPPNPPYLPENASMAGPVKLIDISDPSLAGLKPPGSSDAK